MPNDLEKYVDDVEAMISELGPDKYHQVLRIVGYRRPWRPRRTGWTNVMDQCLHAVYAFIIYMPLILWPSYLTAGLSGLLLGTIREWEQYKNHDYKILMFWDRFQDALFFGLGALALFFLAQVV